MRIYPRLEEMKSEVDATLETKPGSSHEVKSTISTREQFTHRVRVCVGHHAEGMWDATTGRGESKVQLKKFRAEKVTKRSRQSQRRFCGKRT